MRVAGGELDFNARIVRGQVVRRQLTAPALALFCASAGRVGA
jgi:hypothetical protein